jgi:hypothetical protein
MTSAGAGNAIVDLDDAANAEIGLNRNAGNAMHLWMN